MEVVPIMHMFVHTKNSAGLITYDSTGTDSFDMPPKHHELKDSTKVVASYQAVLADFRSQMLDRIRIRPDSTHFDARRLSTNLQPSLCSSLVLDMLFLHLKVVCRVVDVFRD